MLKELIEEFTFIEETAEEYEETYEAAPEIVLDAAPEEISTAAFEAPAAVYSDKY